MPQKIIFIAIVLLLIGVLPLPYGYYPFLRIVTTGVFAWASVIAYNRNIYSLMLAFIGVAIIFNPVSPIHLDKVVWIIIDVFSAFLLFLSKSKIETQESLTHEDMS